MTRFYVNRGYVIFNTRGVGVISRLDTPADEHRRWTLGTIHHRGYAGGYMPVVFQR